MFSAGGTVRCLVATMTAMIRGHGRAFADISAARDYLSSSSDCTGKIGVIGFCMGGGFALLSAHNGYNAAAVNYGQLPRDLDEQWPVPAPSWPAMVAATSLRGAAARLDAALDNAGVIEDTALGELIEELTSHSTEFAQLWPKRCVKVNSRRLTPLLHPRVGPLTVEYEVLTPLQDPDQRVIICRAADTASQAAMDAIARKAERPRLQVL